MHDSLLDVLRREGWKSVKRVCETADCGACSVLLDGVLVNACSTLALQAEGCRVETVESLAATLHPLQSAFVPEQAAQCGYCVTGMVMAGAALLAKKPNPTLDEAKSALAGNVCRCDTHQRILRAVMHAAGRAPA